MPFTLIKGTLNPTFGRPDGDSLRFVPDNPEPIYHLNRRGFRPKINQDNGSIQLRYEGIDTMESAANDTFSQPATESNLELANPDDPGNPSRGYIYSNQIGPNGRPIAFVFSGDIDTEDGTDIFLSADDIMESINVKQMQRGHAYPCLLYTSPSPRDRQKSRMPSSA